jgi:hypothetical protein
MNVMFEITRLPNAAAAIRKSLPFAKVSSDGIAIMSQLDSNATVNEHLVWLWGMLRLERRYLKSLQSEGAALSVCVSGARLPIELRPNGVEMLHLLDATLLICG